MIMCRESREIKIIFALKRSYKKFLFALLTILTITAVFYALQAFWGNLENICSAFMCISIVSLLTFLSYIGIYNTMKKMSSQFDSLTEFEGKCSQDMFKLIRKDRIIHEEVMWCFKNKPLAVRQEECRRYEETREMHLRISLSENLKEYEAFKNLFYEKKDMSIMESFYELQKANRQVLNEEFKGSENAGEILDNWWRDFNSQINDIFALKKAS